jgi:hypothetical protein
LFGIGGVRDDEREIGHQVRRVLTKKAAFLERLHHQRNGALLEVPYATMHELRRTTRRPLAEVVLLDEEHLVAARRCIDGDAHADGAAANDHDVPGVVPLDGAAEHLGAIHDAARLIPPVRSNRIARGLVVPWPRARTRDIVRC